VVSLAGGRDLDSTRTFSPAERIDPGGIGTLLRAFGRRCTCTKAVVVLWRHDACSRPGARAATLGEGRVDLLYLTRDRVPTAPPGLPTRARYATATWDRVADHLEATWADAPDPDGAAARLFIQYLRTMIAVGVRPDAGTLAPAGGRQPVSADAVASPAPGASGGGGGQGARPDLDEALAVAALVEGDRRQRTYPFRWPTREAAEAFRQQLTVRLSEEARAGRPSIAHARPWIWAASSSGRALSPAGEETGVELRFSYYR
jgi:hypothetical protein